ncbi:MAG: prepilin-type N-terminal cleavage/methylation domain-containing protein [Burkholderiales bacterium]|nr:MAG: prepilin-type N-terminal cleavage/methylation domain-containing protein [Burkholderiales bacterium]
MKRTAGRAARRVLRHARGFTLIELIVVIVLLGIVGTLGAGFIARATEAYRASVTRAELSDQAVVAIRRLARDLAGSLPNSVRVTAADGGMYLEFVPVLGAGRYRAFASVGAEPGGNNPLDFAASPPDASFQVLGAPVDVPAGSALAIYNLGTAEADVYAGNNRRATSSVGTGLGTITFAPAGRSFPIASPEQRFFVVATPVSYFCSGAGMLSRYATYGWSASQPTVGSGGLSAATVSRLASAVSACAFELDAGLANIGSVLIRLTLARAGETVTLVQQVNLDATP